MHHEFNRSRNSPWLFHKVSWFKIQQKTRKLAIATINSLR